MSLTTTTRVVEPHSYLGYQIADTGDQWVWNVAVCSHFARPKSHYYKALRHTFWLV